ncbi:peptidoglycan-binding protein [Streptomyces sp. NBC_00637]|uniref:peptidoglycan-binding protein n=1 Tax=Streptomyces sp. NBC_00637 TaxID=2903667 RepID=UPI003249BB2C
MGRLAFFAYAENRNTQHRDTVRTTKGWRIRIGTVAATAAMVSVGIVLGAEPAVAAPTAITLTSASCPDEIVQGQSSGCVTELQNLLNAHGAGLVVDGRFGSSTLYAVREYQAATAIAVDGRVGPATKSKLYATGGSAPAPINLQSSSCPANVVQGDKGGCVSELQRLLRHHGYAITVDGDFGAGTASAVRSFQTSRGLTADGQVGPNTKAALYSNIGGGGGNGAPAPVNLTSASCPNEIVQGQRSGCVTELQSLLNHHGADLAVDGDFGSLTGSAVRDFQAEKGLSVDGKVGPNTKAALYGAVTPPTSPPPGGGYGKILDVAQAEAGTVEGSARANSYGSSVGLSLSTSNYAWCATFVSWVAQQTGATSYRNSYVSGWVKQAQAGNYHLSVTTDPQPGDIVAFDWDGGSDFTGGNEHIGIVRTVSGSSLTTVEGNTGNPNGGGDGVYVKSRGTNSGYDVVFIRVR